MDSENYTVINFVREFNLQGEKRIIQMALFLCVNFWLFI